MKTINLKYPVTHDGKEVAQVTVRRPKVKDIRKIEENPDISDVDRGALMIAQLCDLPVEVVDEMDAEDFMALSEASSAFLPGAATGE